MESLRFWGWPRGGRLGFPRGREGRLEKLLPMASGPGGLCARGGQASPGRSGGGAARGCARARARAAGGGPWGGCGRGPAGGSSPPGLGAPRASAGPARRGGPRASRLPACHRLRRGRGPRAGPGVGARGARGSPLPLARVWARAGGGRRSGSRALPRGHRVRRAPGAEAQGLGLPGGSAAAAAAGRRARSPPAGTAAAVRCVAPCRRAVCMERGSVGRGGCWALPRRWVSSSGRRRPRPAPPAVARIPRSGCYGDSCAAE